MKKYLLDTSICVFLFRRKYGIAEKLQKVGALQCYVSEVTIAELKYGAYKSDRIKENLDLIDRFIRLINIVPLQTPSSSTLKKRIAFVRWVYP